MGSAIKFEISFGFPVSRFPVKFPFSMSALYSSISHGRFLYQKGWKNSITLLVCLPIFMLRHLHECLLQLILRVPCIPDKNSPILKKS